jgi:hypothetical protein
MDFSGSGQDSAPWNQLVNQSHSSTRGVCEVSSKFVKELEIQLIRKNLIRILNKR